MSGNIFAIFTSTFSTVQFVSRRRKQICKLAAPFWTANAYLMLALLSHTHPFFFHSNEPRPKAIKIDAKSSKVYQKRIESKLSEMYTLFRFFPRHLSRTESQNAQPRFQNAPRNSTLALLMPLFFSLSIKTVRRNCLTLPLLLSFSFSFARLRRRCVSSLKDSEECREPRSLQGFVALILN